MIFGKKVSMIIGAVIDSDGLRNRVVFDTRHSLSAFRTDWDSGGNGVGFGNDRVDISGGFCGKKISQVRFQQMAATVKALRNRMNLSIRGFDFNS